MPTPTHRKGVPIHVILSEDVASHHEATPQSKDLCLFSVPAAQTGISDSICESSCEFRSALLPGERGRRSFDFAGASLREAPASLRVTMRF